MSKDEEIIALIFQQPTSSKVKFKDVKSFLIKRGGEYTKGDGSRRKFYFPNIGKNGRVLSLHEPHGKDLCKDAVKDIREILTELGVTP